jgi:hypothetical protein
MQLVVQYPDSDEQHLDWFGHIQCVFSAGVLPIKGPGLPSADMEDGIQHGPGEKSGEKPTARMICWWSEWSIPTMMHWAKTEDLQGRDVAVSKHLKASHMEKKE